VDPDFERNRLHLSDYAAGERAANAPGCGAPLQRPVLLSDLEVIYAVAPRTSPEPAFSAPAALLPDGSLLVSIGRWRKSAAANSRCADPAARPRNRSSALASCCAIPGLEAQPRGKSFATGQGEGAQGLEHGQPQMCRVLAWTRSRAGFWVSEHGARGGDELNCEARRELRLAVVTHSPRVFRSRRSSAAQSAPGLGGSNGGLTPAIAPLRVWRSTVAIGIQAGVAICSPWAGPSRDVRRISLQARWNGASEEDHFNRARVRDVRQGPMAISTVLTIRQMTPVLRWSRPAARRLWQPDDVAVPWRCWSGIV